MNGQLPPHLKNTIKYCYENTIYYHNLFDSLNLSIKEINTYNDFRKIPLTTKETITSKQHEFYAKNICHQEWVSTSGTSSTSLNVPLTASDLNRLAKNEKLALKHSGITSKDTVLLAVALDRLFIAGLAYYLGLKELNATILRSGSSSVELVINTILSFKPTAIIGVPSFLIKVANRLQDTEYFNNPTVTKLIAIGEPVAYKNLTRNKTGLLLEEMWKCKVFSTYASTEMSTSFAECLHQTGGHYLKELVFLEILDDNQNLVMNGNEGELIVTPIGIEGMPLLRYATNDISFFINDKCLCGDESGRIGPILGRKSQMLKIKGTTVFLSSIIDALHSFDFVNNFFITINKDYSLSDKINVTLSFFKNCDHNTYKNKVAELLQGITKIKPELNISDYETIKQLQTSDSSKLKFYKDLRKQN